MKVSNEVNHVFIIPYLQYVWPWIEKIGLDPKVIAAKFQEDLRKQGGMIAEGTYFLIWGVEVLKPMMNKKLGRPEGHPTFMKMMDYIMEPFIRKDPLFNRKPLK